MSLDSDPIEVIWHLLKIVEAFWKLFAYNSRKRTVRVEEVHACFMNHLLPVPNLVQSLTIQPWAKKIKKGLSGRSRRGSSLPTANNFHNKHPYLKYYLCISKFFMIFMIPLKKTGQPMLPMKKTSLKWTHFFQQLSKFKCTPPTYVQFHLENPHRNPNTSSFQGRKFTGFSTSLNIGSWEHPTKWYTTTIYYIIYVIYIHNLRLHYQVLWNIIMHICCIFLNVFCLIPFGSEWNNWYDITFRPTCVGNTHVNGWSCKFTSKT